MSDDINDLDDIQVSEFKKADLMPPGKGHHRRPYNAKKYREGYDRIAWPNKKKGNEDGREKD